MIANAVSCILQTFPPAPGKCSHGGDGDLSASTMPRGGISKDERGPDNVDFHDLAVNAARSASLQLLEDIRLAAGDSEFLRYASQTSKISQF